MSINSRFVATHALLSCTTLMLISCGGGGSAPSPSPGPAPAPAPTVSLTSNSASVMAGSPVTLTWSTSNATSCTVTGGWTGARSASGTEASGNLAQATIFTLACTGAGGNATAQVT